MNTNDLVKLLPQGYEQACFDKKRLRENGQSKIRLTCCG